MSIDPLVLNCATDGIILAKHGGILENACWDEVRRGNVIHTHEYPLCQRFEIKPELLVNSEPTNGAETGS